MQDQLARVTAEKHTSVALYTHAWHSGGPSHSSCFTLDTVHVRRVTYMPPHPARALIAGQVDRAAEGTGGVCAAACLEGKVTTEGSFS